MSSPAYPHLTFSNFFLPPPILSALTSLSYLHPSPIQLHSIPPALHGLDLIAQAESGTGKSLVFAILCLSHALRRPSPPRQGLSSLCLVPTRELGLQVEGVVRALGSRVGVKVESVMGGRGSVKEDADRLSQCDILIATVGRLKHLIDEGLLVTSQLSLLVLDEADALLSSSSSFYSDVNSIIASLPSFPHRQTLLFSATWSNAVMQRAKEVTTEPQLVLLDSQKPHSSIQHYVLYFDTPSSPSSPSSSSSTLAELPPALSAASASVDLLYDAKLSALLLLLSSFPFHQCLIFVRSPSHLSLLPHHLSLHGYPSLPLSSSLPNRQSTLSSFLSLSTRILVTSDVLSRGFDQAAVNLVVHWEDAWDVEGWINRGGRTGRWGRKGRSVWLVERGEEGKVREMERMVGCQVEELKVIGGKVKVMGGKGKEYEEEVRRQGDEMRESEEERWALEKFEAARKEALEEMGERKWRREGRRGGEHVEKDEEDEQRDEDGIDNHEMMPPFIGPFTPFVNARVGEGMAPLFPSNEEFPLDVLQLRSHALAASAQFHQLQGHHSVH